MKNPKDQRILVIDDESDMTDLLGYHLRGKGYVVELLNDPNRGIGVARSFLPDLVVLDVMMPEITGLQLCRMLRADPALHRVPIIFLTAKAEENDRVQGLEIGADDYISKPFSIRELMLRVQSLLRRSTPKEGGNPRRIQLEGIVLDIDRHEVTVHDQPIDLTATEFKLLHILMERRGRVQTREHLLVTVWNYESDIETRTVDTHIRRLREKLGKEADWVETIRGVGYRFAERRAESQSA